MAHRILMEEFHLRVTAPRGLLEVEYKSIARILRSNSLRASLRRAIRDVFSVQVRYRHLHVTIER